MAGWQDWGTDWNCKRHWSGESCSSGGWKAWSGWQNWAEGGGCKGEGDDRPSWPSNCWNKKNSWDSQVPREYCQEELDQDIALAGTTDASPDPVACQRAGPRVAQGDRLWCHIFLKKRHPEFDLVPILIGRAGRNMSEINQATGAKIRVRGRGSRHLEVCGVQEAPVPLMVAITLHGAQRAFFRAAVDMTICQLQHVQVLFVQFCEQRNLSEAVMGEELWSFGEMSKDAEIVLADLLPDGCQLLIQEGHQISGRYAKRNKFSGMERARETASAQGTALLLEPLWAASLPHDACSDGNFVGCAGLFPDGYGSGYSGLHVFGQPGTASNGFNWLHAPAKVATTGADHQFCGRPNMCEISKRKPGISQRRRLRMQLDVDRLIAGDEDPIGHEWSVSLPDASMHSGVAELSFGSQSSVSQRQPVPRAAAGPGTSLDVTKWDSSHRYSCAIEGYFSAYAAATAAPPVQTPGLAASLCQHQREQSLDEQADDDGSECEADLRRRIGAEVCAFLVDITGPTEVFSEVNCPRQVWP
jgi:hypothetical protein